MDKIILIDYFNDQDGAHVFFDRDSGRGHRYELNTGRRCWRLLHVANALLQRGLATVWLDDNGFRLHLTTLPKKGG